VIAAGRMTMGYCYWLEDDQLDSSSGLMIVSYCSGEKVVRRLDRHRLGRD
jgi:hypothetical protein